MSDLEPPLRLEPQPSGRVGKSDLTRAAILNGALGFLWNLPFRDMTVTALMASTQHVGRSGFSREAQALASLDHPNNCGHESRAFGKP